MSEDMDYSKMGNDEHRCLEKYAKGRFSELSKAFQDENKVLIRYEQLICRATLILGNSPPRDLADRSIRDLLADVFDFLYTSRRLILEGHPSAALPLLRRVFESNSLIQYFILLPDKAITWDNGKQIGNAEMRKYFDSHPMGGSGKHLKELYSFYSGASHPNREYIPSRFLGEGNQFVLGAIGVPDLLVVADYVDKLTRLWFWFAALISSHYRVMLCSTDKGYGNDYMNVANGAKSVVEEVLPSKFEFWRKEYNEGGKHRGTGHDNFVP